MEPLCIGLSSSTVSSEWGKSCPSDVRRNKQFMTKKKTGPVAQKGHIVCEISHKSKAKTQRWRGKQLRNKL